MNTATQHPFETPPPGPLWPRWMPDIVWGPIASGLMILIAGAFSLWFREPWLFASLGPTSYILVDSPRLPSAKFYNTLVGHLCGIGAGFIGVYAVGAQHLPPAMGSIVSERAWASVIAIALTVLFSFLMKAGHPPAAATTLLIALGIMKPTTKTVIDIIIGVVITAGFGEVLRLIRLGERPTLKVLLPG